MAKTLPALVIDSRGSLPDRALFIQDEMITAFIDDFMVLPAERLLGNVYQGLAPAVARHDLMFSLTH